MFASSARSRLGVLSECGRLAGLWVRFEDPRWAGSRAGLTVDPSVDPVADVATWVIAPVSWGGHTGGDESKTQFDNVIKKA
eukprot:6627294-Pyramimonas_sp.AAC.1